MTDEFASTPEAFAIGSARWPGVSKTAEECGELVQVLGKLIATNGRPEHWDGTNLADRLQEEIGDVMAAMAFMVEFNGLDQETIMARMEQKFALFKRWHAEQVGYSHTVGRSGHV